MARKRLAAAAAGICLLACGAAQAETAMARPGTLRLADGEGSFFSTLAAWMGGGAERPYQARHAGADKKTFAGPYDLLVTGADDDSTTPMVLASLGLMALIAHRRRALRQ